MTPGSQGPRIRQQPARDTQAKQDGELGLDLRDRIDVVGVSHAPSVAVKMRARAVGVSVRVFLYRYRQQAHLRSQHPAADPDDEDSGSDGKVCLDSLRDKPGRAKCRENRDEDNPARMRQGDKNSQDQRVNGTPPSGMNTSGSCQIYAFLGNGDGTFSQSADITETDLVSFGQPVVGDFNRDGKLDVAVLFSDYTTSASGIMVFEGNGDGTFQSGVPSSIAAIASVNAAGDFDGDGKLDLIGSTSSGISFFHGTGTARLAHLQLLIRSHSASTRF